MFSTSAMMNVLASLSQSFHTSAHNDTYVNCALIPLPQQVFIIIMQPFIVSEPCDNRTFCSCRQAYYIRDVLLSCLLTVTHDRPPFLCHHCQEDVAEIAT